MLPSPCRGRHTRKQAEYEALEAVAEALFQHVELEERPNGPYREVTGPEGLAIPGEPLGLERRVAIDLVQEGRHGGDRAVPEFSAEGAHGPRDLHGLVDQARPSSRIAAEQPQGVVVLRPGEPEATTEDLAPDGHAIATNRRIAVGDDPADLGG